MSDHDRLIATAERVLEDGCDACNRSKVYCRCVLYIDRETCCASCSHVGGE